MNNTTEKRKRINLSSNCSVGHSSHRPLFTEFELLLIMSQNAAKSIINCGLKGDALYAKKSYLRMKYNFSTLELNKILK